MRSFFRLIPALPALAAPALWIGCSGEAPEPGSATTQAEAPAELGVYPASILTLKETGVSRWILYFGSAGDTRILGVGPDDIVKMQMSMYTTETEVIVESILPSTGVRRVSADGTVLEDSLPAVFAGHYFSRDLAPEEVDGADPERSRVGGDGIAEPKNHTSIGCAAAAATVLLVCATAETGIGAAACAIAIAAATQACSGGHCDQTQCNADCTAGGHLYGWCTPDPERCVCHGTASSSSSGGSSGNSGGGWSGGGPTWCAGCSSFEECCGYTCSMWGCC